MRKIILSFILLTASALSGESSSYRSPDICFKDHEGDVVLTADGMQLVGKLKSIPKLTFPFGELSFEGDDLYIMINYPKENKMQYITMDGYNYMGSVSSESLEIEALGAGHKKIDASQVTVIMPNQTSLPCYDRKQKLFTITLDSGEKLTAMILDSSINLSDGSQTISVKTRDISKFSKKEGVFINKDKNIVKQFTALVTDEYIKVVIPKSNNEIQFKWSTIASMQEFDPITDEDTIQVIANALHPFCSHSQTERLYVGGGNSKNIKEKNAVGVSLYEASPSDQSYLQNQNNFVGVVRRKESPILEKSEFVASGKDKPVEIIKLEPQRLFAADQDFAVPPGLLFIDDFDDSSTLFASANELAGIDLAYEELEGIEFDGEDPTSESIEEGVESEYTFISKNHEKQEGLNPLSKMVKGPAIAAINKNMNIKPEEVAVVRSKNIENVMAKRITQEVDDEKIIAFNDSEHSSLHSAKTFKTAVNNHPEAGVMVLIDKDKFGNPFSIAKKFTTNKEYEEFILATGHPRPKDWLEGSFKEGQGEEPVVGVTLDDARQYAKWKNKRLPTQAELHKAEELDVLTPRLGLQEWVEIDGGDSAIVREYPKENTSKPKTFRLVSDR